MIKRLFNGLVEVYIGLSVALSPLALVLVFLVLWSHRGHIETLYQGQHTLKNVCELTLQAVTNINFRVNALEEVVDNSPRLPARPLPLPGIPKRRTSVPKRPAPATVQERTL